MTRQWYTARERCTSESQCGMGMSKSVEGNSPGALPEFGWWPTKIGKVIYRWTEPSLEPYISFIFILVVLPYGAAFITKLLILCDSVKIIFAFMNSHVVLPCKAQETNQTLFVRCYIFSFSICNGLVRFPLNCWYKSFDPEGKVIVETVFIIDTTFLFFFLP